MDGYLITPDGRVLEPHAPGYPQKHPLKREPCERPSDDFVAKAALNAKLIAEDPAGPKGMYVLLPRGAIMASLLEQHTRLFHADEDAFPLRPSALARYDLDPVRAHAELSGEGVYHCRQDGGDLILRHGTLFSQFALCAKEPLKAEALPLRMFEISPCFRYEAGDRIAPLRRPRAFTMIDMHVICRGMKQAKAECLRLHRKVLTHAEAFCWQFRSLYTVEETFWNTDKAWISRLAAEETAPVLLKKADPKKQRPINVEYHLPGPDGPLEIAAVQIDSCNPARFGMRLDAPGGASPVALHLSIVGSLERWLYALLQTALSKPEFGLPVWLAPEQVRFLLNGNEKTGAGLAVARSFRMAGYRVTVDDRGMPATAKHESARKAFVPFVLTPGDSRQHAVKRSLAKQTENYPFHPSSFPPLLSHWPGVFCA